MNRKSKTKAGKEVKKVKNTEADIVKNVTDSCSEDISNKTFLLFEVEKDTDGNLMNLKINRNNLNLFEEIGLLENHLMSLKMTPVMQKTFLEYLEKMENCTAELITLGMNTPTGKAN